MRQKLGILCRISDVQRVQALTACTYGVHVTDPSKATSSQAALDHIC